MKRIRNRVRTIIIMAISPIYILIAQEVAEYNAEISKVFQHVDKSRVTMGLLYDYGLHLIDPVIILLKILQKNLIFLLKMF